VHVLITGVAGFIGSNLADFLLSRGHDVVGLDNLAYGVREQIPKGVELHLTDIRSKDIHKLFSGAEAVFHLAAKNCISDCQANPVETSEINVSGTVNVFEAARCAGVRKVIYAESSAMYEGSRSFPTTESDSRPQSFYAVSKASTAQFADAYRRYFRLNTTALRYFNVYGPRQDYRRTIPPVISAFIIAMLQGKRPVIHGDGSKKRDFVFIDDINEFHLLTIQDNCTDGQTYNLGFGKNYSVLDIYHELESILDTGLEPIFKDDLPAEAQDNLADISKARELGWEPKTELKQGLLKSIEYIQKIVIPVLIEA
jgi:nucleoside-diphosphate-sugar epimerase